MTGTLDANVRGPGSGGDATDADVSVGTRRARDRQISQVPYLPGLDGLRAVAVVAVMIYHANSDWLLGGYIGVEVFFVISGYLITLLLIAEHERTGAIDLKSFWIRRFRRLLPALFLMMLLLSVWVSLFERDALGKLRGDVIAGASYFSNWYQIFIGAGYSAGNDFAPLRHLWSLAVEEQFYVVWPIIMLAFVRFGARRIAGVARWLFLGAIVVTVVVALLDYTGAQQTPELTPDAYWMLGDRPISKPDALYLSTLSRSGGLMLGAAFAMVWRPTAVMRGPLRNKAKMFDVGAGVGFGILLVLAWVMSFDPSQGVHGFLFKGGLFLTGLATLAIIAAITHRGAKTGHLLSNPVLLWIGTRSYGLYLYHWPIYQIIRNIAANKLQFHEFVLAMVATAIITEASYRFVETPIRKGKLGELWRRRGELGRSGGAGGQQRPVLIGGAIALVLSLFAVGSMATAELKQNSVQTQLDANAELACNLATGENCDTEPDEAAESEPDPDPDPAEDIDGELPVEETPVDDPAEGEVPVESETTTVTTVPAGPTRFAVGDSVMLGALIPLQTLGFQVDALESRAFVNGLDLVETLAREGRLPDQMVIHLGTNGRISESQMERMVAAVAEVPEVVLVTNDVDRDYTAGNNELMYSTAAANDNISVLDWQGLVKACEGDCLENDGFHLKPDGQQYYADVIAFQLGIE
ncbi:acyltransferase family protein [Ilumatobacter coccineus]|uniref:acyltransferase family protein n=1 Tax=Ilumatobacter coccineus TaxID=467094 RepID=UPI00059B9639|nr:acyltransferase family protein [Ilumatobacter coccineus]